MEYFLLLMLCHHFALSKGMYLCKNIFPHVTPFKAKQSSKLMFKIF